jgi:hypothetical protein
MRLDWRHRIEIGEEVEEGELGEMIVAEGVVAAAVGMIAAAAAVVLSSTLALMA